MPDGKQMTGAELLLAVYKNQEVMKRVLDEVLSIVIAGSGRDEAKLTIKGTKRKQFFKAVELIREGRVCTINNACRLAVLRVKGTEEDPGYENSNDLSRYAYNHRSLFV